MSSSPSHLLRKKLPSVYSKTLTTACDLLYCSSIDIMLFDVPCRGEANSWTFLWVTQAKRASCISSFSLFSFLQKSSNKTLILFFSFLISTQRQSRNQLLRSPWSGKQVYMSKCLVLYILEKAVPVSLFQVPDLFHQDFRAPIMSWFCAYEDTEFSCLFNVLLIFARSYFGYAAVCPITLSGLSCASC